MLNCTKEYYYKKKFVSINCKKRTIKSILEELYKRLILPFYTLIISLIGASLIIEPKSKYLSKFYKLNIFLMGVFVIILSQLGMKFIISSSIVTYFIVFLPLIFLLAYYLVLSIKTKFKLGLL